MAVNYALWALDDDEIKLGADSDFKLKYDSSADRLEILDSSDNVLAYTYANGNFWATKDFLRGRKISGISTEDLVALWHLEDATTSKDYSANGQHLTIGGSGTSAVGGKFGTALSFNGSGYAEAPDNTIPNTYGNADLSFTAWFKVTADDAGAIMGWYGGASGEYFRMLVKADGTLEGVIDNGTTELALVSAEVVDDGEWHHGALVRDAGSSMQLYLDGLEVDSGSESVGDVGDTVPIIVGALDTSLTNALTGTVDEAAVWAKALNEEEVRALYGARQELADPLGDQYVDGALTTAEGITPGGLVDLSGGNGIKRRSRIRTNSNTPYDMQVDEDILYVDTSAGTLRVNLLPAASYDDDRPFMIQDIGGNLSVNNLTVRPDGTENLNGANSDATFSTDYQQIILVTRNGAWYYGA